MTNQTATKTFPLGRLGITPGALETLNPFDLAASLKRHATGDWGDCCPEDRDANDRSIEDGARLLSVYKDRKGIKFWIITEADRSSTMVLLPEEY